MLNKEDVKDLLIMVNNVTVKGSEVERLCSLKEKLKKMLVELTEGEE